MNEGKKDRRDPIRTVKPRNFVAKNASATTSGAGAHKDKKRAMKQGDVKHKKQEYAESLQQMLESALLKESNPEYDDEAGMSQGSLHTIHRAAAGLMDVIKEGDNLPEWCQEKISLAEDYLVTVWDYIQSEKEQGMEENLRTDNPCWKGYHPVGTKKKGGRTVPNCVPSSNEAANPAQQAAIAIAKKKEKGVAETVDFDMVGNPKFHHEQKINGVVYTAQGGKGGYLTIKAMVKGQEVGSAIFRHHDYQDGLESLSTSVDDQYQKQGIASTMYAYARMLGNTIHPATAQSDDGKAMWKGWNKSGDAKFLKREGVAEESDKQFAQRMKKQAEQPPTKGMSQAEKVKKGWAHPDTLKKKGVAEGDYAHGFADPNAPKLGGGRREFDEPDAVNNIEISINGRPWKVFAGNGSDSSPEFFRQKQKIDDMCKRKTAETGKKWSWGVTGEPATNESVSEGAKVDRQAKHITKSMMKSHPGMSKDDAEAAAWAHIKHPKKKKKAKEGWTHDSLADQLFEHERSYEDKLANMLNKKLGK